MSGNSPNSQSWQQPQGSGYTGGRPVEMGTMNQGQPNQAHGGGYVPQGRQQGQQQEQAGSGAHHGGGYVPQGRQQGQQQEQAGSGDPHVGGYVSGQHQQNSNGNFAGGYASNQYPQGQGQGNWQGAGLGPGQNFGASMSGTSTSKGTSSTGVPQGGPEAVNNVQSQLAQYIPPRKHQRGYRNLWNDRNMWRWKYPNAYQMPGLRFESFAQNRHRDILQRIMNAPEEDRYLSPWDGHLSKLVVQAADDVYDAQACSTWRHTFVRNAGSPIIRIANWTINSVPLDKTTWSSEDWIMVCGKWLRACLALMILMPYPSSVYGQIRNHGHYDAFPYRFWGYAKYWRNKHENEPIGETDQQLQRSHQRQKDREIGLGQDEPYEQDDGTNPVVERLLRPRYLCFLDESQSQNPLPPRPLKVEDWLRQEQRSSHPDYLFVAYTAEQFQGDRDLEALSQLAERATREAGLSAYWVGSNCMPDEEEAEQDVHRISDVIRGAKALAIVVGHPVKRREGHFSRSDLLAQWGRRMWTLPEALLSPRGVEIRVYVRGVEERWDIQKSNFANVAWHDAPWTRQLMDHYEGSLTLSNLELVVLALRCLSNRDLDRRSRFRGDLSYVLMGLLRRRPRVDRDDSAFQAFARLSLANDSNMLLERLVCVHPKNPGQPWLCTDDARDTQLWDIYPSIQIAGVGADDTVILDGAYGAAIRWKAFAPVAYVVRISWKRYIANTLLRSSSIIFFTAVALLAIPFASLRAAGAFLLVMSLSIILASPYLVRVQYGGKLWGAQPWFFGFEGYLDIETIESNIFGSYQRRLSWSPSGSPLSRHYSNEHGECVGLDPTSDPNVRNLVERARTIDYGGQKVFTLIDTYTSTVMLFSAERPPVAVLLCGSEGGMQRAAMCSYDAKTQTLYRESVLRMETPILEKMFRVGRFRFGFRRPLPRLQ